MVRKASRQDGEARWRWASRGQSEERREDVSKRGGRVTGVGDYAKEFHNIRRLKFSHNAGPGSREGQPGEKKRKKRGEACVALGILG